VRHRARRADGRLVRIEEVVTEPGAAPPAALAPEDERLVALLAGGASIAEVAATLGYSRRTVQRRLAVVRQAFGASSNREAVILARRR
jgi:DNA-binding NarL/FixJ family response regulator